MSGNTVTQSDDGPIGGGINADDFCTITHCIVAGNRGPGGIPDDIGGGFDKVGVNIIQATRPAYIHGPGTIINATPLLAPLNNYGGPRRPMALLPNSPARNAATGSTTTSDQRGFPIVGTPDIGAYEAGTLTNCPSYLAETLPATATAAQIAPGYDYDGDGATNEQEWAAVTDPASPASVFRITSAVKSGANVIITFPTITGRTYTLWQSDTLTGAWTDTGQTAVSGDGSAKTFTIPAPVNGVPKRFHRVQVGP